MSVEMVRRRGNSDRTPSRLPSELALSIVSNKSASETWGSPFGGDTMIRNCDDSQLVLERFIGANAAESLLKNPPSFCCCTVSRRHADVACTRDTNHELQSNNKQSLEKT